MSEYSKFHAQLVCDNVSNPGAHFDQCFQSLCGGIQQILVGIDCCVFGQKNDCGPAKTKEALFLAFSNRSGLEGLNDTSDGQSTYLNLQDSPETRVRQHANHALVSKTRRASGQGYRVDGVQISPDARWTGRDSVGREMEAVIVTGCQAKNEASAWIESFQPASKFRNVDTATLYVESAARQLGESEHSTFGGRNQVQRVSIDRSRLRFELT
jgi:hypothetical protein